MVYLHVHIQLDLAYAQSKIVHTVSSMPNGQSEKPSATGGKSMRHV